MKIRPVSKKLLFIIFVSFFYILSFAASSYISRNFPSLQSRPLIGKIIYISIVHITGAAFGVMPGANAFLAVIGCGIFIGIFVLAWVEAENKPVWEILSFSLICSGALGNLSERLFYGYILDYIDLKVWPVFNLNDTFITLGAAGVIFHMLRQNATKDIRNRGKPG